MIVTALRKTGADFGVVGMAALGLLAGALAFLFLVLKPLEARNDALQEQLADRARAGSARGPAAAQTAAKLAALYRHLETQEQPTALLAKLHATGAAAGVALRAGEYRMQKSGGRIERYEITLPVSGSYTQIRSFLGAALAEIPVLSLDQVSVHRRGIDDTQVQAEMRMTLHLVRP